MMSDLAQACIGWRTTPLEDNDADYNEKEEKAEDADDDLEKSVRPYCPHLPY